MIIVKAFVVLAVLICSPSYLLALEAEKGAATENVSIWQGPPHSEMFLPGEQNQSRISADKISSDVVRQTKTETPAAEPSKDSRVIGSDPSNPTANKAVDKSIFLFTEKIKKRFSLYLERSGRYVQLMKEILKTYNIPEDIAFLPIIESGFNPEAYSVARAVGPWQFIAGTAKKYGLKIDWWRDERKDPVKSTVAAANYFKDLYEMFGSWSLAMAAYNAGEGKIFKALNRTKSDDYWALLNTRHIKKETKEYVPRFIAAKMIASDPGSYGFGDLDYHTPFAYDEVSLDRPIDLETAARCSETTIDNIKDLNPEIRRWSTPPNVSPYPLRIPFGKKSIFVENLANTPVEERLSVAHYTVKKGDTLKKISNKTGIPVSVIEELNGDDIELKTGNTIFLPPKEKFCLDRDDRRELKKSSSKKAKRKKHPSKKIVVTSLDKKHSFVND